MRIGTSRSAARVGLDMTPMIDVCFQLIVFFLLSLRIAAPEGDFNVKMPLGETGGVSDARPPIVIRLDANGDGELRAVRVGARPPLAVEPEKYLPTYRDKYGGDRRRAEAAAREAAEDAVFDEVRRVVRSLVAKPGGPAAGPASIDAAVQEVEIDADPRVKFRCTIKAINAVSGFVEGSGPDRQIVKMIEKIRFSPPKKMTQESRR